MKKMLSIIIIIIFIIFSRCNREKLGTSIDLNGAWYVDHIEDEARGIIYPSLIPADSIIIRFSNDSVYGGRTHRNLYAGTYKYNGDSLVKFSWPLFYLYLEDTLGTKFFDLLRVCTPGNCTGPGLVSVINLINGNTLIIKNQTHYKGVLKKI
jgi:hypothetical protein